MTKNQERIALLDKLGLCHKCEKAKPFGKYKYCAKCLEKIKTENAKYYDPKKAHAYQPRRREIYQEKKQNGICVRCSKPATRGMYCSECSIRAKRRSSERAKQAKAERHERGLIPQYRIENNLCYYCGEPVKDNKHGVACEKCAEEMRKYSLKGNKSVFKALNDLVFLKKGDTND